MLLDRYFFRLLWRPFVAILVILVAMLLLESLARMMQMLDRVAAPMPLIGRMAFLLLPEYLGIGLLIAPFLAIALAVRTLSLRGEWQMFAAMGMPPLRLALVPMVIGLACASGELAINLQLRPAGEQRLDRLIADARHGRYGIRGDVRSILHLGRDMVISADAAGLPDAGLGSVFVAQGKRVIVARSADAGYDASGRLSLHLHDGQAIEQQSDGSYHVVRFGGLDLQKAAEPVGRPAPPELDRLDYAQLVARIADEHRAKPALASLAARCGQAWIALLMPLLGLAIGVPSQRSRSAIAIGAGLLTIIAYLRLSALVESRFDHAPLPAFALLLAGMTGAIFLLWRHEVRQGPGAAEAWLGRILTTHRPLFIRFGRRSAREHSRPAMSPVPQAIGRRAWRRPE